MTPTNETTKDQSPNLDFREPYMRSFLHLLGNTLAVSVINFTVWFAITFYVYLETESVFASSVIAGIYLVASAATGIWFGSLVDHHRKVAMMRLSAAGSLSLYVVGFAVYLSAPEGAFQDAASPRLWLLVVVLMVGVIVGNLRGIAMSTMVTFLIPEDRRDKANGLVGTTSGVSFLTTSVISGLLVAAGDMLYVLILALVVLVAALLHLGTLAVPQDQVGEAADGERKVDLRGTLRVVKGVTGLLALIFFATFNNFLGGVFMALMDPYGLSLVSVATWGLLWGVISTGFIIGGLVIARTGLGANPVRSLFLANVVLWTISILFPLRDSIVPLAIGMYVYMLIIPFLEASEQTIIQRVVPAERQGRVFGFAQSVEQAASPLMAFFVGPLTQFFFIPFMTDGLGADVFGPWFGAGESRGIALVFVVAGVLGLAMTLYAMSTKHYRALSASYAAAPEKEPIGAPAAPAAQAA